MYFEFANVLVFTVVAILFVVVSLLIARFLRPRSTHEPGKLAIYECGEPTVGQAWVRFDIRFYTIALVFVVFDVEVALLFPWAAIFRNLVENGLGLLALIEVGTFLLVLAVGLAYVWIRGDIDWAPAAPVGRRRARPDDPRTSVKIAETAPAGASGPPATDGVGGRDA